jgi:hypothetical protein
VGIFLLDEIFHAIQNVFHIRIGFKTDPDLAIYTMRIRIRIPDPNQDQALLLHEMVNFYISSLPACYLFYLTR